MRFLWFDWHDPRGSLRRSGLILAIGLALVLMINLIVRFFIPDEVPDLLLLLWMVGYGGFFFGFITTALALAGMVLGTDRSSRD